jgi:hypothetical protein
LSFAFVGPAVGRARKSGRMIRRISLIAFVLFGILSPIFTLPVRAQSGFTETFNFSTSNGGWTSTTGQTTYSSGAWQAGCDDLGVGADRYHQAVITYPTFTTSFTINTVAVTFGRTYSGFNDGATGSYAVVDFAPGGGGTTVGSDASMSDATNTTLTFSTPVAITPGHALTVAIADGYLHNRGNCASFGSGTAAIKSITVTGIGVNPFEPPGPPDPSLSLVYDLCPELGNDVAIFSNPSLWGAGLTNPIGETKGLLLTNKRASLQVLILPDHKYKIKLIYHETVASSSSQFSVQLANSPFMFVPLDGTADSQTFLAPPANYTPDSSDHANFAIASQLYLTGVPVLGRDLIIDYACLFDTEPTRLGSAGEDPNGKSQEACSFVQFQGTGDFIENARRLIAWLWAGLKSLFDCVLRPLLAAIWGAITNNLSALIRFFTQLSAWIVAQAPLVFSWIGDSLGNLWRWLVGMLGNLLQIALNAVAVLLNNLGLSGLVNGIISFLESLPQAFQTAVNIATIVFEIVSHVIARLFELVLSIIGLVPLIIQATIAGFNNSSSIPFWAPSCSSTNTILAGPCLGFYIIDNTIFDGPIFYIFIMIDGLVAVNVLLWAIERVKKALIA